MLETTDGIHFAEQVVVATGGYQIPIIPRCAERLPADIVQIHSRLSQPGSAAARRGAGGRHRPIRLPDRRGPASRRAQGAPLRRRRARVARRYRGKDVVDWLHLMGYYDMPVHEHPLREGVRDKTNHYVTGRDGGRDIDLRQLALEGMELYGRLLDVSGDRPDTCRRPRALPRSGRPGFGKHQDQHRRFHRQERDRRAGRRPATGRYGCRRASVPQLDYRAAGITSIVWCIGFRTDYSWIDLPLFNGRGHPSHVRGVTPVPGVYFLGLPWLYTWGSGRFSGVARDAEYLAEHIKARIGLSGSDRPRSRPQRSRDRFLNSGLPLKNANARHKAGRHGR